MFFDDDDPGELALKLAAVCLIAFVFAFQITEWITS